MSDAKKEWYGYHTGEVFKNGWKVYELQVGPPDENFKSEEYIDGMHAVHASWREQAEKLADALRSIQDEIGSHTVNEALAEFEKWKEGKE